MSEIIQKYIVPIGVMLTFIASIMTIYFTRKNLKTSKYIDTITTERIKWIEKVRIEISEIIAEIYEFLSLKYLMLDTIPDLKNLDDFNNLISQFDKLSDNSELAKDFEKISKVDLIKKLQLLKLRLNYNEDTEIIEIIDFYISLLIVSNDIDKLVDAWNKLSRLVELTQIMLKNEWEKVKKEAKS